MLPMKAETINGIAIVGNPEIQYSDHDFLNVFMVEVAGTAPASESSIPYASTTLA